MTTQNDRNILFLVATQPKNMGDLLINKLLIDELSKYGNVYIDAEGIPDNFQSYLFKKHNIFSANKKYKASLKRFTSIKMLFKIKNDFVYFFKSPGPHGGISGFKQMIDQIALSFIYSILNIKGVQLNLLGCDIIINKKAELLIEKFNNKLFHAYRVRTTENLHKLEVNGFKNIGYLPDLAFLLYKKIIHRESQQKILISFRLIPEESHLNDIFNFVKKSVNFFLAQGYQVHFAYQVIDDKLYNYELYNQFVKDQVFFKKECIWIDQLDYYNDFEFVLSNRLHVLLLGLLYNAIPVSFLGKHKNTEKIIGVFNDMGLNKYIFGKDNNTPDFFNILRTKEYDKEKMREICEQNSALCEKYIESIFQKGS